MAVQAQYNDNDYKNWVRACLGLNFLKEGLVDYVDNEVQKFHRDILINVCGSATCNGCTTADLTRKPRPRPCPNNVCDKIRARIQTDFRYKNPQWDNTDATKWCTDYWEIAKCFMSTGSKAATSPADTDTSGILSVCINGLFMPMAAMIRPAQQPVNIFHKNREARNTILHSGSMSLSDTERQDYIQDMVALLATYKHPVDNVTQDAIDKLNLLNSTGIVITSTDEVAALKLAQEATYTYQQNLETKIDSYQQDMATKIDTHQQNIETNIDTYQQDMETKIDIHKQNIETKIDTHKQDMETKIDTHQQNIETKIDTHQQNIEAKIDTHQQNLETKINTHQQNIETKIDTHKQDMETKIDTHKQDMETKIDSHQQNMETEIDTHQQDMETKINTHQQNIETKINTHQQNIETKIDIHQQDMDTKIDTFQAEIGRVGSSQHDLENKVDALKLEQEKERTKQKEDLLKLTDAKLLELQTNTNEDVSEIRAKNESLLQKNGELYKRISDLLSSVENLEKGLENVQGEVQDVKGDVQGVKGDVQYVKSDVNDVKGEVHDVKGEVKIVQGEVQDVKSEVRDVKGDVQDVKGDVQDVKGDVQDVKGDVQDVKGDVQDVKGDVQGVKSDVHGVQYDVHDVKGDVKNIKGEVQDVKGEVQYLDEKVQKMYEASHVPETGQAKINIQKYLLEKYKALSIISMPPLLQRIKSDIDDIYSALQIRDDLVHKRKKRLAHYGSGDNDIEHYHDILNDDGKPCKNIFVVGTAGIGKTTWCRKLVCTWCDVISKNESKTVSTIDKTTLENYDLVFYIELRRAKSHSHIIEMIENQLFQHKSSLIAQVNVLMERDEESSRCLIVLDGLDEWVSRAQAITTDGLPDRDPLWKSTIVTTTRSWKLEELQLETQKIDRAVEIVGLQDYWAYLLADKIVAKLNDSTGKSKDVNEFRAQCRRTLHQHMNVPLLLNIFVCLWYEEGRIDELLSQTFCGLVELLIKHAEGDSRRGLFQNVSPDTLKKAKQMWMDERSDVPSCLATRRRCLMYAPFLNRLGKIAFDHLFSRGRESTLVFNYQSISDIIGEEELQIAVDSGILSQSLHCGGSVLEEEFSLSFLHKTVQEYLAALYMVYDDTQSNACLKTYQEYCTNVHRVLEMENVLMCISGMCPKMAGKMSYHIANMKRNDMVHKLLLHCWRQERITSSTRRQIYIKHHFLYSFPRRVSVFDHFDMVAYNAYNVDTVALLNESNDKDITLFVNQGVEDKIVNCIADIRHIRLVDAVFHFRKEQCTELKFEETSVQRSNDAINADSNWSQIISSIYRAYLEKLAEPSFPFSNGATKADSACSQMRLCATTIEKLVITSYESTVEHGKLDLSGCKSLRTVRYERSTTPIQLPTEQLEEVVISVYKPSSAPVLDLSGCKCLRTLCYNQSTAPIQLPSEQLENLEMIAYKPSTAPMLDLSGSKSLRTVRYNRSKIPIQLPTEQLKEVEITDYKPSTAPVLDLSGCKSLKILRYNHSTVPIQLPTEQLEKVEMTLYKPRSKPMLDLLSSKSLRFVHYLWSTTPIQISNEQLEEVKIIDYKPITAPKLDLSECKSLKTVYYRRSTVQIQLPTEQLEKVEILDYKPKTEQLLDLSGCKSLKIVRYASTRAPIQLPTEQLVKVRITRYEPSTKPMLDLSACKSLRNVWYKWSTAQIQLPTEELEKVDIMGYKPSNTPVLDLSGCKSLRHVCYGLSTAPIQLPSEQLETVQIHDCEQCTAPILDLSRCKYLRTVRSEMSTTPIQLPTENLEKVVIVGYTPSTAPVLDLSGCKSLRTVRYHESTAQIQLPTEQLMIVEITGYKIKNAPILDLSGSTSLAAFTYMDSSVPIKLPVGCIRYQKTDFSTKELILSPSSSPVNVPSPLSDIVGHESN